MSKAKAKLSATSLSSMGGDIGETAPSDSGLDGVALAVGLKDGAVSDSDGLLDEDSPTSNLRERSVLAVSISSAKLPRWKVGCWGSRDMVKVEVKGNDRTRHAI